jgi:hypothetical protein
VVFNFFTDTQVTDILGRGQNAKVTADSSISGLTFDPVDGNLYWIDTRRSSVLVQSVRTMTKLTIMENLVSPSAILFLDDRRQLIVADGQRLLSARPDGTGVSVLAERLPGGNATALAYARAERALYLAHPSRRLIGRFGLERRESATTFLGGIGEIADLAVNEGLLYWTEKGALELFWVKMDK